jgi:nuclear factor of activated T-cells 5
MKMLNSQFLYNSNNKFIQNRKIIEEENTILDPIMNTNQYQVSEIDQYLNDLFQSESQNFKTEEKLRTDCEDSGFLTSNSSLSSPQSSPMSCSSSYNMEKKTTTNTSNNYEDYSQLTFEGIANSSNWSVGNMEQSSAQMIPKEIKLFSSYPSKSTIVQNIELRITKQPETHHRARYMTEGSRGTIKDRTGRGYPAVQLFGYNKSIVKLQCFIGHDQKIGEPHLFYQACEVSGKTPYKFVKVDSFNMIELELLPENNMQAIFDCMGILKERNVDVERKVLRNRRKGHRPTVNANEEAKMIRNTNKSRSTHCRMVFRCVLPETGEVLQAVSDPILCTQPLGSPEIYKISLRESDIKGGQELFLIGKNFHKDSKVIFESGNHWRKVVNPQKEFLNSTHLVCQIPSYDGIDGKFLSMINIDISVHCNHKTSDPIKFIYINSFASNRKL